MTFELLRKVRRTLNVFPKFIPEVLQLDTQTRCNNRCVYCNPQNSFNLGNHEMSRETLMRVIQQLTLTGWARNIKQYRPFMNGDPLLDNNLDLLLEVGKVFLPNSKIYLLSNGALFPRSKILSDSRIDVISLSVSAATHETYYQIHGSDNFSDVLKTFRYLVENKRPHQEVRVSFIACSDNEVELPKWRNLFKDANGLDVSMIHFSKAQVTSFKVGQTKVEGNLCNPNLLDMNMACNIWNNLSVSWDGKWLQCCDLPSDYNYGDVYDTPLLDAWRRRIKDQLRCSGCHDCNLKHTKHKLITWLARLSS